jgi:hypothetical protein
MRENKKEKVEKLHQNYKHIMIRSKEEKKKMTLSLVFIFSTNPTPSHRTSIPLAVRGP